MVLIRAIPAAAAAPVRNWEGSDQKVGSAAKIEQAVTVMTAMVALGEPMYRASGMLMPPTAAGPATCQARVPCRVACRDQKKSTMAAGRYGMAVIRPLSSTENSVPYWSSKPLMMVGRKNARA